MDTIFTITGLIGAACCVGMYAGVSFGRMDADRPSFFIVNGLGALLITISAMHDFDMGDLGSVSEEIIWTLMSVIGAVRAWRKHHMQAFTAMVQKARDGAARALAA
jgi:hypothetical protein